MERNKRRLSILPVLSREPKVTKLDTGVLVLGIMCMFLAGCLGGLRKTEVVKAPDSPMLIQEVGGRSLTVGIYDPETNSMIEYGKIRLDGRHEGWTISKFDWSAFIEKQESDEE